MATATEKEASKLFGKFVLKLIAVKVLIFGSLYLIARASRKRTA
jgi:hypothetical protein